MAAFRRVFFLSVIVALLLPLSAVAVIESKSGVEYPDEITVECMGEQVVLKATGVGLREKTFLKVDVYTIVSYIQDGVELEGDTGEAVRSLDAVKRIQMDLRRGFSREKLTNSFTEVIEKNYDDTAAFDTELATFLAYFQRDAEDQDRIIFDWDPAAGLTTTVNGDVQGVIESFDFAQALWTVWFGAEPANDGLKEKLLSEL